MSEYKCGYNFFINVIESYFLGNFGIFFNVLCVGLIITGTIYIWCISYSLSAWKMTVLFLGSMLSIKDVIIRGHKGWMSKLRS